MRIGRTLPPAASPIYIRDIINGIKGLIRGRQEIERFRSELREHFGVKHVFLVSSGKAALTLILKALHNLHPERDEVLIPAFICYSVPSAIVRAVLKVKLCDVNPDTLDFNYDQFKELWPKYHHRDTEDKMRKVEGGLRPIGAYAYAPAGMRNAENKKGSAELKGIDEPQNFEKDSYGSTQALRRRRVGFSQFHPETEKPKESSKSCESCQKNEIKTNPFQNKKTTGRLLAVISAHLLGLPANTDKVRGIVTNPAVTVIEDAAQVLGSTWQDKKLGTQGDVSFFSLGRGKALSTVEGGIIVTNRDDIGESMQNQLEEIPGYDILELVQLIFNAFLLIAFQHPVFFWFSKLLPFLRVGDTIYDPEFKIRKLSAFQAGLTRNWSTRLADFQEQRKKCSLQWALTSSPENAHNYAAQNGKISDFIRYPLRIKDVNEWQEILKVSEKKGLGVMLTYPDSINGIDELREVFRGQTFPAAEKLPHQLVTFPIHPYVSQKDIKKVSDLISLVKNI